MNSEDDPVLDIYKEYLDKATETLHAAGLSTSILALHIITDDNWTSYELADEAAKNYPQQKRKQRYCGVLEIIHKYVPSREDIYYAAQLLFFHTKYLATIANNDHYSALIFSSGIGLICGQWESNFEKLAGRQFLDSQNLKAHVAANARWHKSESAKTVKQLFNILRGPKYEDWSHAELWNVFLGLLDAEHLGPREIVDASNSRKTKVEYEGGRISFVTFCSKLKRGTKIT